MPDDHSGPALFVVAAQVGRTRLIDNADADASADHGPGRRRPTSSTPSRRTTSWPGAPRWSAGQGRRRQARWPSRSAQLRKPTRSAWLVNLVAREEPDEVAELLELGAALQQAQQTMDGDELRRLSKDRRTLIDALARRAGELGRDQGYDAADAAIAGGEPDAAGGPRRPGDRRARSQPAGLHQAVSYGGFGPEDLASALAASMPAKTKPAKSATPRTREAEDDSEEAAAGQARAEADSARGGGGGRAAADEATSRADELADQVE